MTQTQVYAQCVISQLLSVTSVHGENDHLLSSFHHHSNSESPLQKQPGINSFKQYEEFKEKLAYIGSTDYLYTPVDANK